MQVKKTQVSDTEVKLVISATEAELKPIKELVLQKLAGSVKLAGFRSGKAPLGLVEKNVDSNVLQQEFMGEAMDILYSQALTQEKLRPVDQPKATLKKFVPFTDIEVEMIVPVIGEVKIADYKKIKKDRAEIKITAKEVDDVIASLQTRLADKKEVERAAQKDDEAVIDFAGVDEKGAAIAGADGKDLPLVLGSNAFIPGFEDNVIGMKPNEQKTFTLTFPKDYGVKALASKKVTFTVTVKKVHELAEPEVNDKFAAKAGPFKTLEDLKQDIRKQLAIERQQEADRSFENELIKEIAEKSKVAIPKVLVEQQIDRGEQEERRNLSYRGQTWQEHLDEEGVTDQEHRDRNREPAEQQVKASIVLSEISEAEKIDVTPEEVEIRLQILKGQYRDPAMQTELNKPDAKRDIVARLVTEKTIHKLVQYATDK